jgi:non-specific serine/threonine protein kinase/serine/threonine-protein kinase
MGQVWLAEQVVPLRRMVALKLIKVGFSDDEVLQRFQSERQSLAIMDHPAIAKIFDAGATADGQPYFAMEYVPGAPITDYCDQNRLSLKERLELFIRVCEGVQHAHQKAVIHRDLKPANILVAEIDGKPTPRIIDFGLAKAVQAEIRDETIMTRVGAFVGTPGYMSPEQAEAGVLDVDTRTDVYSLGVVLYVLLAGAQPFDSVEWKKQPLHEVLRQLREVDPPRPSTKVRMEKASSVSSAELRGLRSGQLESILHGDLDWIAMKALEKDRARRYDTPMELAADLKRYMANEPILARPAGNVYRMRKYVRRHGMSVGLITALALLLVAFAVMQAIQVQRITRERDRANREAETAHRVSDFLTGLFAVSDPVNSRGNQVTAREILDKGAREIETGLVNQPEIQTRLMATMGNVYVGLGLYPEAAHLVEEAVNIRTRLFGSADPEMLRDKRLLGRLRQYAGRYEEAEALLRSALEQQTRVLGNENSDTVRTAGTLGSLYSAEGKYVDAERVLKEVFERDQRVLGQDDPATLDILHNLAVVYDGMHLYPKEENTWKQLAEARTRVLGPDHPSTLAAIGNLAYVEYRQGKLTDAEKLQREILKTSRRVLGSQHPNVLMTAGNLANTLQSEGRFPEAEQLQREVLDVRRKVLGPDNPDTFFSMNNLAEVLQSEGRFDEAEKLFLEALSGERRVLGEKHPEIASVLYNLSGLQARRGRAAQALDYLRQAVQHGYSDSDEMGSDESLKSLRGLREYQSLFAEVQRRSASTRNSR